VSDFLPARLLARLETLQMGTRRRLAGQLAGEHRSPRHGSSLDFADYRTYHPGDDFRRIDYHLYARLDTLLLKLYEAEDEVRLRLLVDTSASMARGGKLAQAARVAGALGFVSLVRRDPVTLHTFPFERAAPRFVGRNAAPLLFRHLQALEGSGTTPFSISRRLYSVGESLPSWPARNTRTRSPAVFVTPPEASSACVSVMPE